MTTVDPADAHAAFAELGRIRLSETPLNGVLSRVALLARATVSGAAEVSVTLVTDRGAHTPVFTGEIAARLDEWQYREDRGPCIEAAMTTATLSVPDLSREDRWTVYTRRAIEAGVHSALSVGLPVQDAVTGALNLYGFAPHAFDDDAVIVAQTFASYAAVALANAHTYDATATLARQMREAMAHRAIIEQAKGILMAKEGGTADEAFARLSKLSQDSNRKLRDVAAALVDRASRGR